MSKRNHDTLLFIADDLYDGSVYDEDMYDEQL